MLGMGTLGRLIPGLGMLGMLGMLGSVMLGSQLV